MGGRMTGLVTRQWADGWMVGRWMSGWKDMLMEYWADK